MVIPRTLIALLLALVLAACSSSKSLEPSATTAFGSNVTAPPAPVSTIADTTGLGRFIPVVNGLAPATARGADTGPFDLNQAVVRYHSKDSEARKRLTDGGFTGGFAASFTGEGGTTAGVQLYELRDQAAASDFASYIKEHAMQGIPNPNLPIAGVPGVVAFVQRQGVQRGAQPQPGQGATQGTIGGALFVKGPYLAYVGVASPSIDVSGTLTALAQAQYGVLP